MAIIFDEYDKYGIIGKITELNHSTLTISVTSPFISEIKFHCNPEHYDRLHPPVSAKYNWIDWVRGEAHPTEWEASAYYNTGDKCFYKKESGSESKWERTDFDDIYADNPRLLVKNLNMQEKYQFFLSKYIPILHKGQLCRFSAYAILRENRNWKSTQNKQVERHPDDFTWIYDPNTFLAEKWDAESIDGLVKEIRPSRDCLKHLLYTEEWDTESIDGLVKKIRPSRDYLKHLLYAEEWDTESIDGLVKKIRPSRDCLQHLLESYEVDDRKTKREKWDRRWKMMKSAPESFRIWLDKYEKMMIGLGGLIVGVILAVFAILTYFDKG